MGQKLNIIAQVDDYLDKKEKIFGESSVSRYLQLKIPSIEVLDGDEDVTFKLHDTIFDVDTEDQNIYENILVEEVFSHNHSLTYDNDSDRLVISSKSIVDTITEPVLTSSLGEYGKIHVKEDRGGNVFLFDFTEDNKRIFLKHASGTYWNINDSGDSFFKSIADATIVTEANRREVVGFDSSELIKGERLINIRENDSLAIGGKQSMTIGGPRITKIDGDDVLSMRGRVVTNIGGSQYTSVKSFKHEQVGGVYIIESDDSIIIRSPSVSIETGSYKMETTSPVREKVTGEKMIAGDVLTLMGTNNITMTTSGTMGVTVAGLYREVIGGVAIPPDTVAKKVEIASGSYNLTTLLGDINIQSLAMGLSFGNLLASLGIDVTGSVDLKNLLGSLTINPAGEIEMKGAMGSVKVGSDSTVVDHNVMVKIGGASASEPLVGGTLLMKWLNGHTHIGSQGETTPPKKPATPTDFNSTKSFVAT